MAILAILASILFPIFARAKVEGYKAESISNLHQLGLASMMYEDDFEAMVPWETQDGNIGVRYWWGLVVGNKVDETQGPLYPYTHGKGIQADPLFPNRLRTRVGITGYGYNYVYDGAGGIPSTEIARPTENLMFASSARINYFQYAQPTLEANPLIDPPTNNYPGFQARDNGVGTVVWADGHANTMHPVYRTQTFGANFSPELFRQNNLGDLIPNDDFTNDAYFTLN